MPLAESREGRIHEAEESSCIWSCRGWVCFDTRVEEVQAADGCGRWTVGGKCEGGLRLDKRLTGCVPWRCACCETSCER